MSYRCRNCFYCSTPACAQRKATMRNCYVFDPQYTGRQVGPHKKKCTQATTNQPGKLKSNISISITKELLGELQRRIIVFENSKSVLSPEVLADYRNDIEILTKLTCS